MERVKLRGIAAKLLGQVLTQNSSLDHAMLGLADYSVQERAQVFEWVSSTLRLLGRAEWILNSLSDRKKPSGNLGKLLKIAIAQLLSQDTPSALVVSETLEAIKKLEGKGPAGFANAVLRKVSDRRLDWQAWTITEKTGRDEIAAWASVPRSFSDRAWNELGFDQFIKFFESANQRPKTWYRKLGGGDLSRAEPLLLERGVQGNEPPGFVQDTGNQQLCLWVSEVVRARFSAPMSFLDWCAAPGGKSLDLADRGHIGVALDPNELRLPRLRENVARLKFQDRIEIGHTPTWLEQDKNKDRRFDLVWVDAPCSASGIIGRHPEVRWNRDWADLGPYVREQRGIVDSALPFLSENGILVYSVCSIFREERDVAKPAHQKFEAFTSGDFSDGLRALAYSR